MGRYGPIVQLGESANDDNNKKPQFAGLQKDQSIDTVTLAEAVELFKLPREVGQYEDSPITAAVGRFGPYIKHENLFVSLKKDDPLTVTLEKSIKLLKKNVNSKKQNIFIHLINMTLPYMF